VAEAQRQTAARLNSNERKVLLVDAAEATFASRGYTQAGLAEVATLAGVSKTLLYHYFPDGRPELYREVMDRLVGQVVDAVRSATRAPTTVDDRVAGFVKALVDWFDRHHDAYRLLILEPWGSGDAGVVGQALAIRARMANELNQLLAPAGQPLARTLAGAAAAIGAVLQVCELRIAGQLSRSAAVESAQDFVRSGLAGLALL
jgi:AcrR family transcriptional regulator